VPHPNPTPTAPPAARAPLTPWRPGSRTRLAGSGTPPSWDELAATLATAGTWTLATTGADGPHAVPVLGGWVDGGLCVAAGPRTRKGRHLTADPRVALTALTPARHVTVEGRTTPVADEADLERVAGAYLASHGWEVEVRDGALWAEGAPTAGDPPFQVHRVLPEVIFAFSTTGNEPAARYSAF
jgi:nitroimidazol reductase NimA-like FMN-containing flavoprotein (pyridoxamine 5'-phosphate oxidase superfamily)